jgi:transposase-like protein
MATIAKQRRTVNGRALLEEALNAGVAALQVTIVARLSYLLSMAVTHLLAREYHVRRETVAAEEEQAGYCQRCGTHQVRQFSRNGHRPRWLTTRWGTFRLGLPRVVCGCGGSVRLPLEGLIRPYQRTSEGVDEQIQRWHELGLSLRQLRQELAHSYIDPLGLASLLARLDQLPTTLAALTDVPPIVQVDAIWVTQLRPTGRTRRDRRGRMRQVKSRVKRPILLALGVWPADERTQLLACQLADSESEAAWLAFLSQLEAQGLRGSEGLQLLIHDGGSGLCAALQVVHFDCAQQRCLFHKLRNIAQALVLPAGLSRTQRRQQRRKLLKPFRAIWRAKRPATILRRYRQVVRQFRHSQPTAVATLRRDFRATLAFLQVEATHPGWQRRQLCTTSRLERFNRRLRRRARLANAFHSDRGVLRMVLQEARLFRLHPTL